jgi:large subunit ribosomal protein L23
MKNPHDIIRRPVLTERSYDTLADMLYTFEVAVNANKVEIKKAVEEIFDVKVASVNTLRQIGKIKRQGKYKGRRPEVKKAFVRLTKDSKSIAFFDGMVQ